MMVSLLIFVAPFSLLFVHFCKAAFLPANSRLKPFIVPTLSALRSEEVSRRRTGGLSMYFDDVSRLHCKKFNLKISSYRRRNIEADYDLVANNQESFKGGPKLHQRFVYKNNDFHQYERWYVSGVHQNHNNNELDIVDEDVLHTEKNFSSFTNATSSLLEKDIFANSLPYGFKDDETNRICSPSEDLRKDDLLYTIINDDVEILADSYEEEELDEYVPSDVIDLDINSKSSKKKLQGNTRIFLHKFESGRCLADRELKEQIMHWATVNHVVGDDEVLDERESIKNIFICRSESLPDVLSELWGVIGLVSKQNIDPFDGLWKLNSHKSDGGIARGHMILFAIPSSSAFYDYKVFNTVHAALGFSHPQCKFFGHKFGMMHYHPDFRNDDKMTNQRAHSPVPIFALTFGGMFDDQDEFNPYKKKSQVLGIDKQEMYNKSTYLRNAMADLEIIFNRAAASSSNDNIEISRARRNMGRSYSEEEVIKLTKKWVKESNDDKNNKALQYTDTILDYIVCSEELTEIVYSSLWMAVSFVYEAGQQMEEFMNKKNKRKVNKKKKKQQLVVRNPFDSVYYPSPLKRQDPYNGGTMRKAIINQLKWLNSLNVSDPNERKEENLVSCMFITSKYNTFNAPSYSNFAVSVNANLQQLTGGKMFVELFHPEFVGTKEQKNKDYRAPYPVLQIIYETGTPKHIGFK